MNKEEKIDSIDLDQDIIFEHKGYYTFLRDNSILTLFETDKLTDKINHPISLRCLTSDELKYIHLKRDCLVETLSIDITNDKLEEIFEWYDQLRKVGNSYSSLNLKQLNLCRYYLTISDFESHFYYFNPSDKYQIKQENEYTTTLLLSQKEENYWLLRHSLLSTGENIDDGNKLREKGIRYYLFSFTNKILSITDVLITFSIGIGYHTEITGWHPCFIDCLESILTHCSIPYNTHIEINKINF